MRLLHGNWLMLASHKQFLPYLQCPMMTKLGPVASGDL